MTTIQKAEYTIHELTELVKTIPTTVATHYTNVEVEKYGELIYIMYFEKNKTFNQIAAFLTEHGVDVFAPVVRRSMRKWMYENKPEEYKKMYGTPTFMY